MNEIIFYGASDDLIEIESTSFGDEEFNIWLNEITDFAILAVSDGSLFKVRRDEDGIWRFTPLVIGSSFVDIKPGVDDRLRSDKVTLAGEYLTWVALGSQFAR